MVRHPSLFFRIIPWLTFAHAIVFIVFWLTNNLFSVSTNDYLADMLGKRMDYVSLLLWVSAFIAAWSCTRVILGILGKYHRLFVLTSWVYGFISVIYVVFFYASFYLLFRESPVQLARIGQLIGYFRLVFDAIVLLGLALVAAFALRSILRNREGRPLPWMAWVGLTIGYLILWSLPLAFPPGSIVRSALPTKPLLIAHRGASMLAPENTDAAANLAVGFGVAGLETDIQVSLDGQLFLLHDDTFARTTDIATVFPERKDEPAGNFTLDQIRQLNAGQWFVQQDPYGTIRSGQVAPQQAQEYAQERVPLLSDWLQIVKQHNLVFIFDIKQPPESNPYASTIFKLTLSELQQSVNGSLVWFLVDPAQVRTLHLEAPDMVLAYRLNYQSPYDAAKLGNLGYLVVDSEYGLSPAWIHRYQNEQLWVNLFTVDEPWQFSRLWLLGVNSVTTSNVRVMDAIEKPTFSLTWGQYLLVWGLIGLVGLGLAVGLIFSAITPVKKNSSNR